MWILGPTFAPRHARCERLEGRLLTMAELMMQLVGEKDGLPIYSPVDKNDAKLIDGRTVLICDIKGERAARTRLQNRSMHLYSSLVSKELNDSGWTKKKYYEVKEVDIGWTPESVLDDIWRGIQEAMFQHRSTSKLKTEQVSEVYDRMSRHLSEFCNVTPGFPDKYKEMEDQLGYK